MPIYIWSVAVCFLVVGCGGPLFGSGGGAPFLLLRCYEESGEQEMSEDPAPYGEYVKPEGINLELVCVVDMAKTKFNVFKEQAEKLLSKTKDSNKYHDTETMCNLILELAGDLYGIWRDLDRRYKPD